jgi:heterotetrameric sarcosine oxidase gamma subunit
VSEAGPVARSPIATTRPRGLVAGWSVLQARATADLRLADWTPLAKILVRASPAGNLARWLGVDPGRAAQDRHGTLVVRLGPDEWLLLARPGQAGQVMERCQGVPDEGLVTVLDMTSGRILMRLTGGRAPEVLAKVCAVDTASAANGAAFRTAVAGVATEIVRDDHPGPSGPERSYLLGCDWSFGQYLFDALMDAGGEFRIQIDGFFGEDTS